MFTRIRDYFDHPYRLIGSLLIASALVLALAVIGATRALAADVTVTWTHPTQFTDGSTLALGQIASTRVEYGSCSGSAFGTRVGDVTVPAPATTTTIAGFAPGTHCFRAFTRTTAAAGGQESAPSAVASRVIAFPPPNPPTIVTVATVARLWRHGLQDQVGRIALNVPCGTLKLDARKADWYTVPRAAVTLNRYGRRLPADSVIVAKCGAA